MNSIPFYQHYLTSELARRCQGNPRYSLRAYSRSLGIDAGTVSRLLSGRQIPSEKMADRLLARLDLAPRDRARFLATVGARHQEKSLKKATSLSRRAENLIQAEEISLEIYRVIADWYHVAILELTFVEDFRPDPRWIARQLGVSATEAKLAVERLISVGLLRRESRTLRKTHQRLTSADKGVTTPALRQNQRQLLEKAIESLENDPFAVRDVTSTTMAIDPRFLPEARRLVQEFHLSLSRYLQSGERRSVYNLEVCLYPLQKRESNQ